MQLDIALVEGLLLGLFPPTPLKIKKEMDVLPMCSIFQELQIVHDTGYFSALPSLEEYWQQVNEVVYFMLGNVVFLLLLF